MTIEAFDRVQLDGTGIDRITEEEVVAVVREALAAGRGGRIITPNIDILRRAQAEPEVRRLSRRRRPDRGRRHAAGLGQPAGRHPAAGAGGRQQPDLVALRGAGPGPPVDLRDRRIAARRHDGAARAADRLAAACPGLRVAGTLCPDFGFERDPATYEQFCAKVIDARPDWSSSGSASPSRSRSSRGSGPACRKPGSSAAGRRSTSWPATSTGRRAGCSAPGWSGRTGWASSRAGWPAATCGTTRPYALRLLAQAPGQRVRAK